MNGEGHKSRLKMVLGLVVVVIAARALSPLIRFPWQHRTNRAYLHSLIEDGYMQKTAHALVEKMKPQRPDLEEFGWHIIENNMSQRMTQVAYAYAASNDPYLEQEADGQSGLVLASKILGDAGLAQ